jgi:hypothetical protein
MQKKFQILILYVSFTIDITSLNDIKKARLKNLAYKNINNILANIVNVFVT